MVLLLAFLLVPLGLVALIAWARWLPRRTATPSWASRVAYGLLMLGAGAMVLVPVAIVIRNHFGLCGPGTILADAQERQRLFASSIAEVFYDVVMTVPATLLVTALWLLFATWRWHWSARSPAIEGDPPYR